MRSFTAIVAILVIALPLQLAANGRDIVAASSTSGAALGAIGGFWGLIALDKQWGYDTDGWDGLLIGGPAGFFGGGYLGAAVARSNSDSREVSIHKVVLGNALGALSAVPVMMFFNNKAEKSIVLQGVLIAGLIGGAFAGARIGANNLSVATPAIRF